MSDIVRENNEEYRRVREFLYVDLQRVRSYYSQLNRGVIDSVLSRESGSRKADVQARIMGIGAAGGGSQEHVREESRSLQDLSYVIFEELFEEAGLISDVEDLTRDPELWKGGHVHNSLAEGSIIRHNGLIQILDPQFINARIEQFGRLASASVGAGLGEVPDVVAVPPTRKKGSTRSGTRAQTGNAAREQKKAELLSDLLSGTSLSQMKDIADTVAAFTNGAISVRVLPCGRDYPNYHFAGTLLGRSDYIQEEREALFSRYGVYLDGWTAVMQIAKIPTEAVSFSPNFDRAFADENGLIDRTIFEQLVINLVGFLEQQGLSEGSRFPAVSTTVLAIYREFA